MKTKNEKDLFLKSKPLVAALDDEHDILELIKLNLEKSGFSVKTFSSARTLLDFLKTKTPDIIILDLMLPDMNGIDICRFIKEKEQWKKIPVLMLTARGSETDIVLGLELGADDYMVKPFSPRELSARIKAVLRRTSDSGKEQDLNEIRINDTLVIDLNAYQVFVSNQKVSLTRTEFTILRILAEKPGWVFSREKLLARLWGDEKFVVDRTIDVHIKNLRDKLGKSGKWIKNVRGVGYKLEK